VTKDEVQAFVGKPVRVIFDDEQVYAGILESDGKGYIVRNKGPVEQQQHVHIDNADRINEILDASDDPAATG